MFYFCLPCWWGSSPTMLKQELLYTYLMTLILLVVVCLMWLTPSRPRKPRKATRTWWEFNSGSNLHAANPNKLLASQSTIVAPSTTLFFFNHTGQNKSIFNRIKGCWLRGFCSLFCLPSVANSPKTGAHRLSFPYIRWQCKDIIKWLSISKDYN